MARLPVGYRQRKDGKIECRFVVDGKRYSCYADNVKECREKERELREKIAEGLYTKNRNLTLDKYYGEWLYELLALLICTGMRVGEATALTWQDIDYKNNMIHVTKTISRTSKGEYTVGTPKSDSSIRDIPMTAAIKEILWDQKQKQDMVHGNVVKMSRPVFENLYGGMVFNASVNTAISNTLKRINKDKEIIEHCSAHALRILLQQGTLNKAEVLKC